MVILWGRVLGVLAFLALIILLIWTLADRGAAKDLWEDMIENENVQGVFALAIVLISLLLVLRLLIRIIKMVIGWIRA